MLDAWSLATLADVKRRRCCGIANDGFISLVRRWGRDVHFIVVVLGRLTTRHISCKGVSRSVSVVHGTLKKSLGRLVCENNQASLTNQCLTTPAMCTVPDPSPRTSALHHLSSSTIQRKDQVILAVLAQYLRHSVSV